MEVEVQTNSYNTESREGFEIKLSTLPPDITHIRFYNSY